MMIDVSRLRAAAERAQSLILVQADPGWFDPRASPRFVEFEIELHRLAAQLDGRLRRFMPYGPMLIDPEPAAAPFYSVIRKATVSSLSSRGILMSLFTTNVEGSGLRRSADALLDPAECPDLVARLDEVSHPVNASGLRTVQRMSFDPHAKVAIDA